MKKVVKSFGQNAVNHWITSLAGVFTLGISGYYLFLNINELSFEKIGITGAIALLGLVLIGAKDRINLFQKTYNK